MRGTFDYTAHSSTVSQQGRELLACGKKKLTPRTVFVIIWLKNKGNFSITSLKHENQLYSYSEIKIIELMAVKIMLVIIPFCASRRLTATAA